MKNPTVKECRECGSKFQEKQESFLYECEHCMRKHEE
ncbi:protein YhfH [Mesobacillus persicus]|nr:protein YhfH [Mesobacillus persicus]